MENLLKKSKSFIASLFELSGDITKTSSAVIGTIGFFIIMLSWYLITSGNEEIQALFPSPGSVFGSFKELHFKDFLVENTGKSIYRNFYG